MRDVSQLAVQPENLPNLGSQVRIARGWLNNMGLHYRRTGKGVYIDSHKREDVRQYREQEFVPRWLDLKKRFCKFDPENIGDPWRISTDLGGENPIMLVTHGEAIFNANDAASQMAE